MISVRSRSRGLLIAAVILAGVLASIPHFRSEAQDGQRAPGGGGSSAVPVSVASVERRDVPHRVSGIGTVQSLHTVVIRPQVTGILTEVLFKEGELVEQGALLARIDDRAIQAALAQAQAEKASKEAQLRSAELDLSRYGSLIDQHVISRQTLDQQSALVEQIKAAILASEATIAAQRVQLSFTRIVSPVRGRAGIRRVDPGNLVQAGDTNGLVTVTQIDPISVLFTLPQSVLASLSAPSDKSDTSARVTAYERDAGTALATGRLTTFDNQVDTTTGTLRLRAQFDNRDGKLWPGQFVTLQLDTGVSAGALVVPARAVQQGLNGSYVYRVRDSKAEVTPVVTEYLDDEIAVIGKGVAAGDSVVIDGQSRLKAGSRVTVATAGGGEHVAGS